MGRALLLPYPPYLWRVVRRTAFVWLLLSALLLALSLPLAADGTGAALHPLPRAIVIGLAWFLVWWDRRRYHEVLLHANLAAHPAWLHGASLATAALLDAVTAIVLAPL